MDGTRTNAPFHHRCHLQPPLIFNRGVIKNDTLIVTGNGVVHEDNSKTAMELPQLVQ